MDLVSFARFLLKNVQHNQEGTTILRKKINKTIDWHNNKAYYC